MYAAYLYILRASLKDEPGFQQQGTGERLPARVSAAAPPPRPRRTVLGRIWSRLVVSDRQTRRPGPIPAARTGR